MYQKKFRPAAYAILSYQNKMVFGKKTRWPFEWQFCLIWWGIEHGEDHYLTLQREIAEEVGIKNFEIKELLNVFFHVSKFTYGWIDYDQHAIWIVYLVEAFEQPMQWSDDCGELIFIDPLEYKNYDLSPMASKAIKYYLSQKI